MMPDKKNYIPYQKLVDHFNIQKNDLVLVVSEVLALAGHAAENGEKFDPALFLESIENKIGPGGTILVPTFHFGFSEGKGYDYKKTGAVTGSLGLAALKKRGYRRTLHPIHSFAVWGRQQETLCALKNVSSFGPDSPFAFLHKNKGKMWIVGRSYRKSFTFVHYVEESEKAPYRYLKAFTGPYTDEHGREELKTYKLFVRDLDRGVRSEVEPIGHDLEAAGAATALTLNGIPFRLVLLDKAYPVIANDIKYNAGKKLHVADRSKEGQLK